MNLLISTRRPIHRLMLISAALLVCADGALGADFVGDGQMQARAQLTGTSGTRPNAVEKRSTAPTDGHQTSRIAPQEQARQLLLGTSNLAGITSPWISADSKRGKKSAVSARDNLVYVAAQESARRMILGIAG
jgi:hypothetical protein